MSLKIDALRTTKSGYIVKNKSNSGKRNRKKSQHIKFWCELLITTLPQVLFRAFY